MKPLYRVYTDNYGTFYFSEFSDAVEFAMIASDGHVEKTSIEIRSDDI